MTIATKRSATARATLYLFTTVAGRAIVFAGLLLAAATLTKGEYARFALAYQIGLFTSYVIGAPLSVAGLRLKAQHGSSALARRMAVGIVAAAVPAGVAAAVLVPDVSARLSVATAVFAAAATTTSIMTTQASAEGYASTFARWNVVGSLVLPLGVLLSDDIEAFLWAAAIAMAIAPLATAWPVVRAAPAVEGTRLGRLPLSVLVWSAAHSSVFIALLAFAARTLPDAEADRVALALTFVQALLVIPFQFAAVAQPQLVQDTTAASRARFADTMAALVVALAGIAFVVMAAAATADVFDWSIGAPMAVSVVPLALGLTGAYVILSAHGRGFRFVAAPLLTLCVLVAISALRPDEVEGAWLAVAWATAATVGALSQSLNESWPFLARPVLAGLAGSCACAAVGFVHPALAAALALIALATWRHELLRGLAEARSVIAAQR